MPEKHHDGWTHYHRWGRCGWGRDLSGFYRYVSLGWLHIAWVRGDLIAENRALWVEHWVSTRHASDLRRDLAAAYEALKHSPKRGPGGKWVRRS